MNANTPLKMVCTDLMANKLDQLKGRQFLDLLTCVWLLAFALAVWDNVWPHLADMGATCARWPRQHYTSECLVLIYAAFLRVANSATACGWRRNVSGIRLS